MRTLSYARANPHLTIFLSELCSHRIACAHPFESLILGMVVSLLVLGWYGKSIARARVKQ
jgi:hypothetical protein